VNDISRAGRRSPVLWIAPGFLILHGFLAVLLPTKLTPYSTLCIVLAQLAALYACLRASRSAGSPWRTLWWLLAFSILFAATSASLDLRAEIMNITESNPAPGLQILLSTLYGVPLLLAVSIQFHPRAQLPVRIVSVCLSLATGTLCYVLVFSFLSIHGSNQPGDVLFISYVFDALDLFLAIAASIRAFGADQPQERRFFYIVSIFLWVNTVFPAIHNRLLMRHDFVWLDLFISAPYLLLLALTYAALPQSLKHPRPPRWVTHVVRSVSPIFLSFGLLLLGIVVSRKHFYIGATSVVLAILCYGVLSVLMLSRGLKAEELLLAANRTLETLAGVDGLTGIPNRRTFDQKISIECNAANRSAQPISLLMIDVDFFKALNDASGHQLGDVYLVQIARALENALPRTIDFVARYGGEEFAVLLPLTGSFGAASVAGKLHRAISALRLEHPSNPSGIVTVSIGISTSSGSERVSPVDLTQAADRALYKAKSKGRDRTEFLALNGETA